MPITLFALLLLILASPATAAQRRAQPDNACVSQCVTAGGNRNSCQTTCANRTPVDTARFANPNLPYRYDPGQNRH